MASVVDKQLSDGSKAYLVRFRTADGKQRSKQFKRRRDALAFANVTEVDRQHGTLVDPRLGRITVGEWWDQWWPTVTNLRPSTKARDEQFFRTHARPVFGSTPLGKLDRTALRSWVADLGSPEGSNLAPATIHRVVQLMNKCVRRKPQLERCHSPRSSATSCLAAPFRRSTPKAWSSSRPRDSRSGRRSFVDASGVLRLRPPASNHSASTTSDTPPCRSGSLKAPTPSTSPRWPATPRSLSCWIDTATSTRNRTTN